MKTTTKEKCKCECHEEEKLGIERKLHNCEHCNIFYMKHEGKTLKESLEDLIEEVKKYEKTN